MGAVRVGFISLGCCKNLVDSQNIITLLMQEGYRVSSTYERADVVIVNTCGFIEDSVRESLEVIGEALDHCPNVIVTGCLGPSRELILSTWPRVKAITGPHSAPAVLEEMRRLFALPEGIPGGRVPPGGILLTPPHYAYLKISEGCSNKCTFCIIPKLRGPLESFPGEELVLRARNYVSRGVKELMVVAQDTSAYGIDRGYPGFLGHERGDLYALLEELSKLEVWLRVHYAYPYPHVTRLIEMMAAGKVLPYMDVPFQHASKHMMQLMKRPGDADRILDTVSGWRKICPDITIRSSFIVGFPGETEDDFRELLDFIREIRAITASWRCKSRFRPKRCRQSLVRYRRCWWTRLTKKASFPVPGRTLPILTESCICMLRRASGFVRGICSAPGLPTATNTIWKGILLFRDFCYLLHGMPQDCEF